MPRESVPIETRFWSKVDASGDCWEWTKAKSNHGYGKFQVGRWKASKLVDAHRFAWELLVGPIPDGHDLDHRCRHPACVNPDHLDPVSHRINVVRGQSPSAKNSRKPHCPTCGSEYEIQKNKNVPDHRFCRPCRNLAAMKRYYRQKELST